MHVNKTVKDIANIIKAKIIGDEKFLIKGFSGLSEAKEGDISFLSNTRYVALAEKTLANVIVVDLNTVIKNKICLQVENPSLAITLLVESLISKNRKPEKGIHKTAVIGNNVELGVDVCIGAHAVIEDNVVIEDASVVSSGVFVGKFSKIGKDCFLYPNVVVREEVSIGDRVIIHSNSVIGSDGFGYDTIQGKHRKIPQIGEVIIDDDVEIGACVTVDRARFDKTFIGKGTKIDNLVQIAHNVIIGENCLLVAQSGFSGSLKIGNNVTVGGQAGFVGHINIGDGAIIGARSGVTKDVPAGVMCSGFPAKEHNKEKRIKAIESNLPEYIKKLNNLEKMILELEKKVTKKEGD